MSWIIALSYWIHLITTILWVGSLTMSVLVAFPAWKNGSLSSNLWIDWQRKFVPIINVSMVLLWISGFIQMTQDAHYTGFLSLDSTWAVALLAKHIAIFGMMGLSLFVQLRLYPEFDRIALLAQKKAELAAEKQQQIILQEGKLLRINMICALFVLLCTAIATAV